MEKLRQMAAAFIFNQNRILMMKRAETRELAPGLWAPVGGHLKAAELNNPSLACLREIKEETGYSAGDLLEFRLKYLLLREKAAEIRLSYLYFGKTNRTELAVTNEGTLSWVDESKIMQLQMTVTTRLVLENYFNGGHSEDRILVGVMRSEFKSPVVQWSLLEDWEE